MRNISLRLLMLAAATTLAACQQGSNAGSSTASADSRFIASSAMSALSDIPTDAIPCTFNGQDVADGSSVTAFQNSTVPYGQTCTSETRLCTQGALSGSYQYASCTVDAAADCLFSGATVKNGDSVTAYASSSVAYGNVCSSVAETRTCNNGVLSGSAPYSSCQVDAPRSCLFNGVTVDSGASVIAFQGSNVGYGQTCTQETRTCTDGTLSGSFQYSSCTVDQAASCLFNGQTVANGQTVVAFQSSSVSYGQACQSETRTCNNGVLSGQFEFNSCVIGQPATCSFNGQTVENGASVIAYASESVAYGQTCQSETRVCSNGILSGSMSASSCAVQPAAGCMWNGVSIDSGSTVTAFTSETVPYGSSCQSETRTCTNGVLSGSAQYTSCAVDNPPPAQDCSFNGSTVTSGASVIAYASESVAYGQTCQSETRSCDNGVLSGSYTSTSCVVDQPKSCTLNGKTINNGDSVTVFTSASVPYGQTCQSEVRTCNNGVLSGSATAESCVVQDPPSTGGGGEQCQSKFIWEFPDNCHGNCGKGVGYFKSRISRDGGKTWMVLFKNRMPDDIEQVWNQMVSKNGKNSCDRPNVTYTASVNRGYVVMNVDQMPSCDVCKFVEVDEDDDDHDSHHGDQRKFNVACHKKGKKVTKFVCGDNQSSDHDNKHHDHDDDHGHHGKK